jgi:hypothetical protein
VTVQYGPKLANLSAGSLRNLRLQKPENLFREIYSMQIKLLEETQEKECERNGWLEHGK